MNVASKKKADRKPARRFSTPTRARARKAKLNSLVNLEREFTASNVKRFMQLQGIRGLSFDEFDPPIDGYTLTTDELVVCGKILEAFECAKVFLELMAARIRAEEEEPG